MLKSIGFSHRILNAVEAEFPFANIGILNKAGRGYLASEDSPSRGSCIEVLTSSKVNNDLDCLFYYLKEANPILLAGYHGREAHQKTSNNKQETQG